MMNEKMKNMKGKMPSHVKAHMNILKGEEESKTFTMKDFYVNSSDNPLYNAFSNKSAVHPGEKGMPIFGQNSTAIWNEALKINNNEADTTIYIHIPFCTARCLFCPFYVNKSSSQDTAEYTNYLIKEIELSPKTDVPIRAIYFGGGTPTELEIEDFEKIFKALYSKFTLATDCEITIEGRVHGFNKNQVKRLIELGVNRFSLGVQSFETDIRRTLGRICERKEVIDKLNMISSFNSSSVVIDLIYGLPKQTMESWQKDIYTIFEETNIDGVDLYQLNILKGTPLYKQAVEKVGFQMASIQEQADLFVAGDTIMKDNFARRDSLRHYSFNIRERGIYNNLSRYGSNCLHFGSGAGGRVNGFSAFNTRELNEYYDCLKQNKKPIKMLVKATPSAKIFSFISGSLEQKRAVNLNKAGQLAKIANLFDIYKPLLEQWDQNGVIKIRNNGWIELTTAGEFWNVNVAQYLINFYKWKHHENF